MTQPERHLMALDPGTHHTGVALFAGRKVVEMDVISPPSGLEIDERIGYIVRRLDEWLEEKGALVQQVAVERPMGIDGGRPAPELQVLIRRLRRWATRRPNRWSWFSYHPSTVLSTVRPRGMRLPSKDLIWMGVTGLYPDLPAVLPGQDAYDAVAVGHCHLVKMGQA